MPTSTSSDLHVLRLRLDFEIFDGLFGVVRHLFVFQPGDDRATGILYGEGREWSEPMAELGPNLIEALEWGTGIRFEVVAFQAYRNGSGCDWHADTPFDAQAVLSLGATRTFGVRVQPSGAPTWIPVHHGDLVYMPSGFQSEWEHCVPVEPDKPGERISLVFRTPKG